jgi:flagellar hook assembly protein FlgD
MIRNIVITFGATLAIALSLLGCQTAKPVAPAESAIRLEESGFAPKGSAEHSTIELALLFGNGESIKTWTVSILGGGTTYKSWSGSASYLSTSLSWDGTGDDGTPSPEGTYLARLAIEYGKTYQSVTVESRSFVLDRTPPTGRITLDPPQFVPSDKGVTGPVTLLIEAASKTATVASWTLSVYDLAGSLVKSFDAQWPANTATWDGSALRGGFVTPALTYKAVATVRDEFGLSSELTAEVPVSEIPMASQQTVVRALAPGFSPVSKTMAKSIDFALTFGNADALKSWKLSMTHADEGIQRSWTGDAANPPRSISWDGRTASGGLAPEGSYTAVLSVDYGKSFQPVLVRSGAFLLDITPPAGNVSASPVKLEADGKGGIRPVTFTLYGNEAGAPLTGWSLSVLDAGGRTAASFEGGWPPTAPVWDGALAGGGKANPTRAYSYVGRFTDAFGNVGEARGSLVTGELPTVQGQVAVTPKSGGFSPNGDEVADSMTLAVSYGQPSAVTAWKLTISEADSMTIRTFSGDASEMLPTELSWDGMSDQGVLAADGSYTAVLSVSYGTVFAPAVARSTPFVMVTTEPTGSIRLSADLFSPMEGSSTISLTIDATSRFAAIDSWSMDIYDPGGSLFRSFSDTWPSNSVTWDGKSSSGELVQSAEDYPVVAKVRDQFGNTATLNTVVPVDILVEKTASGYRILASRIFFKAFTADYVDVAPDLAQQNAARLDALSRKLAKFPGYKIRAVGHAVMINWDNPRLGKAEQEVILVPLSKARADAIMKALVERGLEESRFTTEGVGASDQLVPDSNYKDRWQNRRVALFLDKE